MRTRAQRALRGERRGRAWWSSLFEPDCVYGRFLDTASAYSDVVGQSRAIERRVAERVRGEMRVQRTAVERVERVMEKCSRCYWLER